MNESIKQEANAAKFVSREEEAKKLVSIVGLYHENPVKKTNTEIKSINIFIDARWGDGKSIFLENFFIPEISNSETMSFSKENIQKISVWDYDYLNNPIEMFFELLQKNDAMWKNVTNVLLDIGIEVLKALNVIPNWVIQVVGKLREKKKPEKTNEVIQMNKLFKLVSKSFSNKYIIIFEDLDRCKPEFSRAVVEIAKHVFNNENITMLFVGDWVKLNSDIIGYTNNVNDNQTLSCEYYLSKIIDYRFILRSLDLNQHLFNKYFKRVANKISLCYIDIIKNKYELIEHPFSYNYITDAISKYTIREQEKIAMKFTNVLSYRVCLDPFFQKYSIEMDEFLLSHHLHGEMQNNIFYEYFIKNKTDFNEDQMRYILWAISNSLGITKDFHNDPLLFQTFIDRQKCSELADMQDETHQRFIEMFSSFSIVDCLDVFKFEAKKISVDNMKLVFKVILKDQILNYLIEDFIKNFDAL